MLSSGAMLSDLNRSIDIYCERLTSEFWAEPLNALSNLAFAFAAFLLTRLVIRMWREGNIQFSHMWLVGLVWSIALGSFLFHTFANVWSGVADSLPIALFMFSYIYLAMRLYLNFGVVEAMMGPVGLFICMLVIGQILPGGNMPYLASLLAIFVVAGMSRSKDKTVYLNLLRAGGVFAISLTMRVLDMPLCSLNPHGVHWLWHMFNALTLYILTGTFLRHHHNRFLRP